MQRVESGCQSVSATRVARFSAVGNRLSRWRSVRYFECMINEGDQAPDFDLETDEGTRVSLSSLKGKNVVLFFYPKDNTSG